MVLRCQTSGNHLAEIGRKFLLGMLELLGILSSFASRLQEEAANGKTSGHGPGAKEHGGTNGDPLKQNCNIRIYQNHIIGHGKCSNVITTTLHHPKQNCCANQHLS